MWARNHLTHWCRGLQIRRVALCLISTTYTIQLVLGEDVARKVAKVPNSAASQKLILINMINVCWIFNMINVCRVLNTINVWRVYLQHILWMVRVSLVLSYSFLLQSFIIKCWIACQWSRQRTLQIRNELFFFSIIPEPEMSVPLIWPWPISSRYCLNLEYRLCQTMASQI